MILLTSEEFEDGKVYEAVGLLVVKSCDAGRLVYREITP